MFLCTLSYHNKGGKATFPTIVLVRAQKVHLLGEILLLSFLRRKYNTDFFGQHIQSTKLLQKVIFEPNFKNIDKNIENTRVRIQIMNKVFGQNPLETFSDDQNDC